MFSILVCDDDVQITNQVEKLLKDISSEENINFNIITKNDGGAVINESISCDIAVVDVEMPNVDGLKLSKFLKSCNPDVIILILTSFSDYLDRAMDIRVFRYLSKPVDPDRFNRCVLAAIKQYKQISRQIVLDFNDEVYTVKTRDILYIENLRHGSLIVTKFGKYKTNKKPNEWAKQINLPGCFAFSHKSFLVNLQNVINFDKTSVTFDCNGKTTQAACVSQRKYAGFKKAFFDFAGGLR